MENDDPQPTPRDTDGRLGAIFDDFGLVYQLGPLYLICGGAYFAVVTLGGHRSSDMLVGAYWCLAFTHLVFTGLAPWRHARMLQYDAARRAFLVMASTIGPWIAVGLPNGGGLLTHYEEVVFPLLALWSLAAAILAWWQRPNRAGWLTWGFSAVGALVGVAGLVFRMIT